MKHDDIDKLVQAWIVDAAQRPARLDALRLQRPDSLRMHVMHDALVTMLHQAPCHVTAHASQSNHAELHRQAP